MKDEILRLALLICVLIVTIDGQTSSIHRENKNIEACFEKYIKPVQSFVVDFDGGVKLSRCVTPSQQLCDLSSAISQNNYQGIKCLVDAHYDFNVEDGISIRYIPIFQAAFFDSRILELLLGNKIPINLETKDLSQGTPLYFITTIPSSGLIDYPKGFSWDNIYRSTELLLKHGANPNIDVNGITPLIFQADTDRDRFIELLLRYNANPNIQSLDGKTALMLASDRPKVIDLFLTNGAGIYLKDSEGKSAIFHAVERCQVNKTISLLEKDPKLLEATDITGRSLINYLESVGDSQDCKRLKNRVLNDFSNRPYSVSDVR